MESYTLFNEIETESNTIYLDLLTLACNSQDSILAKKFRATIHQRMEKLKKLSVQLTSIIDVEAAFTPHNLAEIMYQKISEDIENCINFDMIDEKKIKTTLKKVLSINDDLLRFRTFARIIFEQRFVNQSETPVEMVLLA
jgi:hypothetical protein